jgi:hypothetical protein
MSYKTTIANSVANLKIMNRNLDTSGMQTQ